MSSCKKSGMTRDFFAALFLFAITFFVYREALEGGLVWDATSYLVNNSYITAFRWENIKWMFSTFYLSNWHPLTWLSYTLDYVIYGKIWGVALTNVILHCTNTILVFIFTLVLIKSAYKNQDFLAAFTAALFFGIHPQHVESVAWLAERKDVLCLLFILLTFISYISYARESINKKRAIYYSMSLLFFVLALLSKPMAVTLPALLIIIDFYPLGRLKIKPWSQIKGVLLDKIPFVSLSLFVVVITILAQDKAINSLDNFSIKARFFNVFDSYILYISKFIFPVRLLPVYYDFSDINSTFSLVPFVGFFLISILSTYYFFQGKKYFLASWLFYVVALLPVIGIVKIGMQSSADRYAYLPTLPFYILVGYSISFLFFYTRSLLIKGITILSIVTLGTLLISATSKQVLVWNNELALWSYIIKVDPDHGIAHSALGDIYFHNNKYKEAIKHYEYANSLRKLIPYSVPRLALCYLKEDQLKKALHVYRNIIEYKADVGSIPIGCFYYNAGLLYIKQGLVEAGKDYLAMVDNKNSPEEFDQARKLLARLDDHNQGRPQKENMVALPKYCEKMQFVTVDGTYITEKRYLNK